MGIGQLKKLKNKNNNRKINYYNIKNKLENDPRNTFLSFAKESDNADIAWFGVTLFLDEKIKLAEYLNYLTSAGVENRPIILAQVSGVYAFFISQVCVSPFLLFPSLTFNNPSPQHVNGLRDHDNLSRLTSRLICS